MKIALLNDTHFGCRNDSPAFLEYQNLFYDDVFFPYLEENNIKCLIHLGDVVDRRKFINHKTAHNFRRKFWSKLYKNNIESHIIIGNHDTYYKNTNEVNALTNLKINSNSKVYSKSEVVTFDGLDILFIPWICDDNYDDSLHMIDSSNCEIAMGHLEVKGFEMHKGHFSESGLEKSIFKRYEKVISGHFHKKSDDGHIFYLGTQYEITWSDYKCPKGFHIFDTDTRELTRVPNSYRIHKKIIYNDKENDYSNYDVSQFDKCFVKLIISNKTDEEMYNKFVERLYSKINVHQLQIIDDPIDINISVKDDVLQQGEDTLTFLRKYIDQIETDLDKNKLKEYAKNLYSEASE
tara:strand:+ start:2810 stop:3856 length:1047 start_codon:yes stop_codon:yes gene_type:complete